MLEDFHTHNLSAIPGTAVVNLPLEALLAPDSFVLAEGGLYSVGIHPWWTDGDLDPLWLGLCRWIAHPQVVAIGECGMDRIKGAELSLQESIFLRQARLAESFRLPITIHCVKAFDRLLALRKLVRPTVVWTVHGFRGKPLLARQLLSAGLNLSFGRHYNAESWALTPPERRFRETDDDW